MSTCLRRLLLLSVVLLFAAAFYNMGLCERVYAAKPDAGTSSGSGMDNYSSSSTTTTNNNVGSGKPWKSYGNDDIDETQHFLGTTDDNDIVIKTNNTEKARITSEGNVGIGTDTPAGTLHVEGGIADGAADGTDIIINAQDGGPVGGAGGDIVLKPGIGAGFLTDEEGNPIQATGDDGSPLFEDDGNGNLVPVYIPNSGNVIIDGNLAPSSGHALTLGTPELRYSGIYLASWFKYDTDGLYFYYTADERTPVDYFHARFTVDATPYIGGDGWTYFNVDTERSGNFIISPNQSFESALGTEKLQVDGDVISTGNVDAVSFTGDGSTLSGVVISEADPAFTASASSSITNAGSNQVITAAERTSLGTALQSETDPTVDLDKLKLLAGDDFHALGGVDADTTRSDAEIVAAVDTAGYVSGAHTADTNTQLSEAQVDGFVANNNFSTGAHTTKYTDAEAVIAVAGEHTVDTKLDKAGVEALVIDIAESQITDLTAHTVDTKLDAAGVAALESDPDFNGSAASSITSAGSNEVITAAERINLGTAVQTETDPTITLTKLEDLVVDFHTLGGVDADTDTQLSDGQISIMGYLKAADLPAETDPAVGANTLNYLSKWDGSALVESSIFDNGKVGIGTASPGAKLHVVDTANSVLRVEATNTTTGTPYLQLNTNVASVENWQLYVPSSGNGLTFRNTTDTLDRMVIDQDGYVGIGTANPSGILSLASSETTGTHLRISNTSTGGSEWRIYSSGSGNSLGAGLLSFNYNGSGDALIMDSNSGNVGIGTTPQAKLHIGGTPGVDGIKFPDGTVQTTAATSGGGSGNPSYFYVSKSSGQHLPWDNGPIRKVTWQIENSDTNDEFDLDGDKFVVGTAGKYLLSASVSVRVWNYAYIAIRKNGVQIRSRSYRQAGANVTRTLNITTIEDADVGDYFEVYAGLEGDPNTIQTSNTVTYFKGISIGAAGADGINGSDGAQGPAGAKGDTGAQGLAGADGVNGSDGAQGSTGAKGTDGATGPQGIQGETGAAGPGATLFTLNGNEAYYDAGNIGIGTTSPTETLTVDGTISTSGGVKFSDGTTQTTAASAKAFGTHDRTSFSYGVVYQAATDGFVVAAIYYPNGGYCIMRAFMDSFPSPTTVVSGDAASGNYWIDRANVSFPVRKGDYWKVVYESTEVPRSSSIQWTPFGS